MSVLQILAELQQHLLEETTDVARKVWLPSRCWDRLEAECAKIGNVPLRELRPGEKPTIVVMLAGGALHVGRSDPVELPTPRISGEKP